MSQIKCALHWLFQCCIISLYQPRLAHKGSNVPRFSFITSKCGVSWPSDSNMWYPDSNMWHPDASILHPDSNMWDPNSSIWHPDSNICHHHYNSYLTQKRKPPVIFSQHLFVQITATKQKYHREQHVYLFFGARQQQSKQVMSSTKYPREITRLILFVQFSVCSAEFEYIKKYNTW